ncbi:hypothetical protein, partial [Sutterella wadsworthensis]|uniref:hypothetical protein n=1 Tax=Sutterella wadsworthensis TaxID=40545 RepID=UPI003FED640F
KSAPGPEKLGISYPGVPVLNLAFQDYSALPSFKKKAAESACGQEGKIRRKSQPAELGNLRLP